jgi:hypothetical protein
MPPMSKVAAVCIGGSSEISRRPIVLLLLVPVATAVAALISLAAAVVLIWVMIAFEHRGYGPGREQLRREASAA